MLSFMQKFENQAYALMRIVTGCMFLCHGWFKFWTMNEATRPFHIQWIAGPIELIGGTLVMIGLWTRSAAFLCSGMAAAAYWVGHFPRGWVPLLNGGESAVLFAFAFLYISAKGTGIWGVSKV